MTSNLGSNYLMENHQDAKEKVLQRVKQSFKPEFVNRIDELIVFNPLNKEVQYLIVDKLLSELKERLDKNGFDFAFTKAVKDHILDAAFDIHYGARPLKRFIQHHIESIIARQIVDDLLIPKKSYLMDYQHDQFTIKENE